MCGTCSSETSEKMNGPDVMSGRFYFQSSGVWTEKHTMKTNPSVAQPHAGDFTLTGTGTVYLFHPLTPAAQNWLAQHYRACGSHLYHGDALAIEHRFYSTIVLLAGLAGLRPLKISSPL